MQSKGNHFKLLLEKLRARKRKIDHKHYNDTVEFKRGMKRVDCLQHLKFDSCRLRGQIERYTSFLSSSKSIRLRLCNSIERDREPMHCLYSIFFKISRLSRDSMLNNFLSIISKAVPSSNFNSVAVNSLQKPKKVGN